MDILSGFLIGAGLSVFKKEIRGGSGPGINSYSRDLRDDFV